VSTRDVRDLRAAVIGTGFIAGLHLDALHRIGVPVAGVLTRDGAAARAGGRFARVYEDLDELCADGAVDVVHVTSPNALHFPQVRVLVAAGKHVVCEKPLALTAEDGEVMLAEAQRAGVVHAVCFNIRFNPVVHHARDLVRSGAVGAPRLVSGSYLQDWLLRDTDWNWRLDPAASGPLRAVADIGSHWFDLVQFVTGARVSEVFADLHTFLPVRRRPTGSVETFSADRLGDDVAREPVQVDSEDAAGILLRFEGGARGVLTVSQVSAGRKNALSVEVSGSTSALAWNSEDPERLWIGHRGAPNELLLRDATLLSPAAAAITHYPGGHAEGFAESFLGLLETVYAAVLQGEQPAEPAFPTFSDGVEGLHLEDAVLASHHSGRWAPVRRRTA